jgi:hypothetical protein
MARQRASGPASSEFTPTITHPKSLGTSLANRRTSMPSLEPEYQAVLRARLACPVQIVVVTLDEDTAQWCAEPIDIDGLGSRIYPVVIGPSRVPAPWRPR